MNRRNFIRNSALALFGFSILPSAGRIWKATPKSVTPKLVTNWAQSTRYSTCYNQAYIDFLTDMETKKMLESQMVRYYQENYARHS